LGTRAEQTINVNFRRSSYVHFAIGYRGNGKLYSGSGRIARSVLCAAVEHCWNVSGIVRVQHGRPYPISPTNEMGTVDGPDDRGSG